MGSLQVPVYTHKSVFTPLSVCLYQQQTSVRTNFIGALIPVLLVLSGTHIIDKYSGEIPVRNSILVTASTIERSETKREGSAITRVHTITQ